MLSKDYLYHLVRVNDFDQEFPSIDLISIVNEFLHVFPEDLPGIPAERDIDICVELDANTKKISITPYRIAPAELK